MHPSGTKQAQNNSSSTSVRKALNPNKKLNEPDRVNHFEVSHAANSQLEQKGSSSGKHNPGMRKLQKKMAAAVGIDNSRLQQTHRAN